MNTPHAHDAADDVELVQKRGVLLVATILAYGVSVVGSLFIAGHHAGPELTIVNALTSLLGSASIFAWRLWPRRARGRLEVQGDAVSFAGRPLLSCRTIKHAVGYASSGRSAVRVQAGRASCELRFARPDEASRFLAAISQSAGDATATFYAFAGGLRTQRALIFGGVGFLVAGVIGAAVVTALAFGPAPNVWRTVVIACLAMAPVFAARALAIRRLVVGTDGILVRGPMDRSDFLSFARLREVTTRGSELLLSVEGERGARRYALGGVKRLQGPDVEIPIRAIVQRIEEARQRGASGGPTARDVSASTVLARGRRSVADWMRDLSIPPEQAAHFRAPAIPRDQLWRVLDDTAAQPELRAGAAIALRAGLADEERSRLRVAANVSAAPALKSVLHAVESADEEALAQALEELELLARFREE